MNIEPQVTLRVTGVLLALSVLAPLITVAVVARGDFSGFDATIRGIEGVGERAGILHRVFPLAPLTLILTLAAFGLLTIHLHAAGDNGAALLAFTLIMVWQIFTLFQGTFHSSVTVWAARELAATGSVPELFEPLWRWMYSTVQQIYVYSALLAFAMYGWSMLQSGALPAWLGWSAVGWSAIWLIAFLVLGDNLPLVLYVPPLVLGIVAILL